MADYLVAFVTIMAVIGCAVYITGQLRIRAARIRALNQADSEDVDASDETIAYRTEQRDLLQRARNSLDQVMLEDQLYPILAPGTRADIERLLSDIRQHRASRP